MISTKNSPCEKDRWQKHEWVSIGVLKEGGFLPTEANETTLLKGYVESPWAFLLSAYNSFCELEQGKDEPVTSGDARLWFKYRLNLVKPQSVRVLRLLCRYGYLFVDCQGHYHSNSSISTEAVRK